VRVEARKAEREDVAVMEAMYRGLEREMAGLHAMWPIADGLEAPAARSLLAAVDDPGAVTLVGMIDEIPFGFLLARVEETLAQGGGEQVGSIRIIYVDRAAREVAVGEAMRDAAIELLRERGISKFDAHVLPGHRLAKNFYESGGFSARSIIMFRDDERD